MQVEGVGSGWVSIKAFLEKREVMKKAAD